MKHKTTIVDLFNICNLSDVCLCKQYTCGCKRNRSLGNRIVDEYEFRVDECGEDLNFEAFMTDELLSFFGNKCVDEYDYFYIGSFDTLVLVTYVKGQCPDCECEVDEFNPEKIYCMDMPRPVGFDSVIKYHGIVALSRCNLNQGIDHLHKVVNTPLYETCCASAPIGALGAILDGKVVTASNEDLYSHVDRSNGQRYFELEEFGDAYEGIIHYADQLRSADTDGAHPCNELITINNSVNSIWVKIWATAEEKKAAVELAEYYNVELIIIDEALPPVVERMREFNGIRNTEFDQYDPYEVLDDFNLDDIDMAELEAFANSLSDCGISDDDLFI